VTGQVTLPLLVEAGVALPGLFLGSWLGILIYEKIPDAIFRWVILALLTINAFILILT
jgi:hypothetical protein